MKYLPQSLLRSKADDQLFSRYLDHFFGHKAQGIGLHNTLDWREHPLNVAKVAVRDAIMSVCGPERTTQVLSLSSQARAASCLTFSSLYLSSSTFEQI